MIRFSLTVFCLLTFYAFTGAQEITKLDLRLWNRLMQGEIRNVNMPLLVQGKTGDIKELTAKYGGTYKASFGDISSIEIPEKNLLEFARNKAVIRIENTQSKGTLLMDTARIKNNIDSAHRGYAPLIDSLKGKGVIIGIIDGGIYWQHEDFYNADGTTRIRYIWDQAATGSNSPLPYNYGNQWSWININNGNCTHTPPTNDFGHGTCVAGIAAGNSRSTIGTPYENQLTGVAPEAEIIAVRVNNDADFLSNVADAVDYVFKKADAIGKPCVINTSIGTYYGSHDGKDLATLAIENLLNQRNGRVLVAAAGNAGNVPHHLSYTIPADSAYTFFKYNTTYNEIYFDLWADTADFNNASFAVGCNDPAGNNLGRIDYLTVQGNFNPPQGSGTILSKDLFLGGTLLGKIMMQASLVDDRYHVEFLITPGNTSNLWRLQTKGSGTFDLWSSASLIGSADMTSVLATGDTSNPFITIQYPNYRHPDTLKTMVSSWQNSDKVITVGNYSNRAGYLDRDGNYVNLLTAPYNEVVGQRFATSSIGPTRDGRLKPDIMATGSTTIATGDAAFIALATSATNRVKVYITQKHIRNGGTSMAAPIVSGIAALYLQKRPTAPYEEVKQAIICTAVSDNFTGTTPNPFYGNGKVNGFAALTRANCLVYGATDTTCINYSATATVDTGSCVAKVYGCTDSTALNYNPQANISNGDCQYGVGIKTIAENSVTLTAVPNPFKGNTTFTLKANGLNFDKGEIQIVNQLGAVVAVIPVNTNTIQYVYSNEKLSAGIYYYLLVLNNRVTAGGKLIAE
jgi:subtilisin family serine protease